MAQKFLYVHRQAEPTRQLISSIRLKVLCLAIDACYLMA